MSSFPLVLSIAFRDRVSTASCEHESKKSPSCVISCSLLCWKAREHDNQKAKMHVIVLASQKGGAGKTTLAAHLAIAAEAAGAGRAVLIDTDPQGSLSAWWNVRESDSPSLATTTIADLPQKLSSLKTAGFAVAVIDTPPAITDSIRAVVATADLVLIPTRPSPHDLRAVGSTVEIVQAEEKPFIFVVTQAKPHTHSAAKSIVIR